jgi:hypothetical protein
MGIQFGYDVGYVMSFSKNGAWAKSIIIYYHHIIIIVPVQ